MTNPYLAHVQPTTVLTLYTILTYCCSCSHTKEETGSINPSPPPLLSTNAERLLGPGLTTISIPPASVLGRLVPLATEAKTTHPNHCLPPALKINVPANESLRSGLVALSRSSPPLSVVGDLRAEIKQICSTIAVPSALVSKPSDVSAGAEPVRGSGDVKMDVASVSDVSDVRCEVRQEGDDVNDAAIPIVKCDDKCPPEKKMGQSGMSDSKQVFFLCML